MTATPSQSKEKAPQRGTPVLVVKKVARILDAFEQSGPELTAAEISRTSGLPRSTLGRLLLSLVHQEILERHVDRYRPGRRLLFWGSPQALHHHLAHTAQPILDQLRNETGETTLLFVPQGDLREIVAMAPTHHLVVYAVRTGQLLPLHAGSGGRALLAYDAELTERVLSSELTSFSDSTITDAVKLHRNLDQVRREGVTVSLGERTAGVAGISAPVFGLDGEVCASIGVAGPAQRFTDSNIRSWRALVLGAGRALSRLLTHGGPSSPVAGKPTPTKTRPGPPV